MDRCPPEVLHQIFGKLPFRDVATLRLMGSKYAAVGVEFLAPRIRFHTSEESLLRLKAFSEHPEFRKHIKEVVFEDSQLAEVGCEHSYAAHYNLQHHAHEKPQAPDDGCTTRERRLYERNLAKFDREVQQKYQHYRKMFDSQKLLRGSSLFKSTVGNSTAAFPKLEKVELMNLGRCKHALSERFMATFAVNCAMPIESDSKGTASRLKMLLLPGEKPRLGLKSLAASFLAPDFFLITPSIPEIFKSLKRITISFRLEDADRDGFNGGGDVRSLYHDYLHGALQPALSAAHDLKYLHIAFSDPGHYSSSIPLSQILGETSWPKLKNLDIDHFDTDEESLIATLKRQPALTAFWFGNATLDKGSWVGVARAARKLSLTTFYADGVLEDTDRAYTMHFIDVDMYLDDFTQTTRTSLLDMYVTDPEFMSDEDDFNPLDDYTNFDDPDEVMAEYGYPDDMSDSSSHFVCD